MAPKTPPGASSAGKMEDAGTRAPCTQRKRKASAAGLNNKSISEEEKACDPLYGATFIKDSVRGVVREMFHAEESQETVYVIYYEDDYTEHLKIKRRQSNSLLVNASPPGFVLDVQEAYDVLEASVRTSASETIEKAERSMQAAEEATASATSSIVAMVTEHAERLQAYGASAEVDSEEGRIARNTERKSLVDIATKCVFRIGNLFEAHGQCPIDPSDEELQQLQAAAGLLKDLQGQMQVLQETLGQDISTCRERLLTRHQGTVTGQCQELHRLFPTLVSFAKKIMRDVEAESSHKIELLQEDLASLKDRRLRFLRANESPTRNSDYGDVLVRIEDVEEKLKFAKQTPKELRVLQMLETFSEKVTSQLPAGKAFSLRKWFFRG